MKLNCLEDDVQFDHFGRMIYHPEFHDRHGETFTEEELEYLCKYWEYDGQRLMAYALGRTEHVLRNKVYYLRKNGKLDYYKNLNKHF